VTNALDAEREANGHASLPQREEDYADETAATIDAEVRRIVQSTGTARWASCTKSAMCSSATLASSWKRRRLRKLI
jgi:hypothetical protein